MPDLRERRTILVADDVPENIELLSSILEHDYKVKVATHGEKVVEIVYSDAPPDLILLDVMMPRLSGHEVCRRIKANSDRHRIPIIFVTTMTSVEDEKFGFELGAVDYITKPISPPIVLARVRTHLALYDQSRELERMVRQRTQELTHSRQQIIRKLSRAAEFKDNETGNHVLRMAHYSMMLAAEIKLPQASQELLGLTAPMHDVGKIGIPDHILLKPGKLDAHEWELMKQHPIFGADIWGLKKTTCSAPRAPLRCPTMSAGTALATPMASKVRTFPWSGRIVAVADVFDALITARPYKRAFSVEETMDYMTTQSGRHFEPRLIDALVAILPEVLKIQAMYADELGTVQELEPGRS